MLYSNNYFKLGEMKDDQKALYTLQTSKCQLQRTPALHSADSSNQEFYIMISMKEANHKFKILKFKLQFLKLLAIQATKKKRRKNHQKNTLKAPKYPAAHIVWKEDSMFW